MTTGHKDYRKSFIRAGVGTLLVAVCCFTPILVVTLGIIGLGFLTPSLDYILLPALVVLVVMTVMAYREWRKSSARYETASH